MHTCMHRNGCISEKDTVPLPSASQVMSENCSLQSFFLNVLYQSGTVYNSIASATIPFHASRSAMDRISICLLIFKYWRATAEECGVFKCVMEDHVINLAEVLMGSTVKVHQTVCLGLGKLNLVCRGRRVQRSKEVTLHGKRMRNTSFAVA